jgi:membrane protein implicated in regulation of membrane protease activity
MENGADLLFFDSWAWLIFIGIGLVLVLLELLLGVDTGLDLVFIGSALILGGLITFSLHSWVWTLVASVIICILYIVIGRRYIHRRIHGKSSLTNVDTIIGKEGIVKESISPAVDGRILVGSQDWRARSEENIPEGATVTITGIKGVTLIVKQSGRI